MVHRRIEGPTLIAEKVSQSLSKSIAEIGRLCKKSHRLIFDSTL